MRVDLILLGTQLRVDWPLGSVHKAEATPYAVASLMGQLVKTSTAEGLLFWDGHWPLPTPNLIVKIMAMPGDVWHAGLCLGMSGLPRLIDHVAPTWMLNRDPSVECNATSWRMSLRACLMRTEVLKQMGGVSSHFTTLDAAAMEMGHRYVSQGVLLRHTPSLLSHKHESLASQQVPFEDELRFIRYRFGTSWFLWTVCRVLILRKERITTALRAWFGLRSTPRPATTPPFQHARQSIECVKGDTRVTILIPTIDRYSYLWTLLQQLCALTIVPHEVIVIDQTPPSRRQNIDLEEFPGLPLRMLFQDQPGQCSARNVGLENATGTHILFLDDDDEIEPDLIERHLRTLQEFQADVSCGVADEDGAGPLPTHFTYLRTSDVFPTNNALLQREALCASGLFDLAYDRGRNEDGDLGMRLYLSGSHMILNPEISVIHHHAPVGGLRTHKQRTITYASSRRRLRHRTIPSVSELYQFMRYFTPEQVREMLWIEVLGTFSLRGPTWKRILKVIVALFCLPHTLWRIKNNHRQASRMMKKFPRIPSLGVYATLEEVP